MSSAARPTFWTLYTAADHAASLAVSKPCDPPAPSLPPADAKYWTYYSVKDHAAAHAAPAHSAARPPLHPGMHHRLSYSSTHECPISHLNGCTMVGSREKISAHLQAGVCLTPRTVIHQPASPAKMSSPAAADPNFFTPSDPIWVDTGDSDDDEFVL